MTWYSKYVQPHVSRIASSQLHAKQAFVSFMKPHDGRRGWLAGSAMLMVAVPVAAYALHSHSNNARYNAGDALTSADDISSQSVDLNVESALGQYGQDNKTGSGIQPSGDNGNYGADDVSLQATINGQEANVTVNGSEVPLDPNGGSYHETIEGSNGTTEVDVSIKNGNASYNGSNVDISTSSDINISSSSHSSGETEGAGNDTRHGRYR